MAKAKEYRKELDEIMVALTPLFLPISKLMSIAQANMPDPPPLSITELAAYGKKVEQQKQVLKEKRARVEAFQGLPPVCVSIMSQSRRIPFEVIAIWFGSSATPRVNIHTGSLVVVHSPAVVIECTG